MDPEKENGSETQSGENNSAVVVDLTEADVDKQVKPLTADQAGDQQGDQQTNGSQDDLHDEDDDQPRGRKDFSKRLKREQRAKLEARATAAAVSQENDRLRQENEQLRTQRVEREETANTADIDAKLEAAQLKLEKAIEDGDSKAQAKLNIEIAQLTSDKSARVHAPRRQQQQTQQRPTQDARPKGPTPTGKAFLSANAEWWDDPEMAPVKQAVIAIDDSLIRNGSDPSSERHYERIAKRAREMGLKVKISMPFDDEVDDMGGDTTVDLNREDRRERRAPPQGGNGNSRNRVNTEVRDARAGRVILQLGANHDGPDAQTMRTFKLDPTNPAHVKAFAKSRQERITSEAQS